MSTDRIAMVGHGVIVELAEAPLAPELGGYNTKFFTVVIVTPLTGVAGRSFCSCPDGRLGKRCNHLNRAMDLVRQEAQPGAVLDDPRAESRKRVLAEVAVTKCECAPSRNW